MRAIAGVRLRARNKVHRSGYAKRASSACASAISGISGVGAKRLRARVREPRVGFDERLVDR